MKRGAEKQLTKDGDASDEEIEVCCNMLLSLPCLRVRWLGSIHNVQKSR